MRQLADRNGPVEAHVIVDLPHRAEGRLAPGPDPRALVRRLLLSRNSTRVVPFRDLDDLAQLLRDLGLRALDLHDQQRLHIRIARMGKGLAGADAGPVHELDRHRQHTRLDDVADTHAPATSLASNPIRTGRAPSGLCRMRRVASVTTPNCPSDPHSTPQQVVSGGIQMRPADLHDLALHGDQRHPHQVVGRHPVLQAMRPARIHRDIARDGAGKLAGRIRRIEEPVRLHRSR